MLLKNGTVLNKDFVFEKTDISISDKKISTESNGEVVDCTGLYIVPGLIDIHTHGAMGADGLDGTPDAINTISAYLATGGVTTFLANVMTNSHEAMLGACKNIAECHKNGVPGAKIGGIYMEGPYFSEKYKGAQNPNFFRNPSVEEFEKLNQDGLVRIISLAPETAGATDFIKAKKDKVRIFIGHTDADYETAKVAISLGASGLTHTFNGMRGFHHRTPNAVGASLESGIFCECICDGFHLSSAAVKLIYNCVKDKLVLVSDAIRPTGLPDGEYDSGGQDVFMKNGEARLSDGTIAGSSVQLITCVKKAIEFGIPAEDAFRAATIAPAKAAGIDADVGSIEPGKCADLLILDNDFNIKNVIINGKLI